MTTALATTDLVDRINAEHRACMASYGDHLAHGIAAGRLLLKQKKGIKHGDWQAWLGANFEGSGDTARLYMRVARGSAKLGAESERITILSLSAGARVLAPPKKRKSPKPQVDEEGAAMATLRKSGQKELLALVEVGDDKGRQLNALQAVELLDRLQDGSLTPMKFAAHVKQGIPGVREGLNTGPEKPKRSHTEQLAPEWVELRTLVVDARKLLADWTRQQKSVAHLARAHPNKALAEKALKAVEKLTADVFVIEEELRKYLKT